MPEDRHSPPCRSRNSGAGYPAQFHHVVEGRFRGRLGDAAGLTQFGVNLSRAEARLRLAPAPLA